MGLAGGWGLTTELQGRRLGTGGCAIQLLRTVVDTAILCMNIRTTLAGRSAHLPTLASQTRQAWGSWEGREGTWRCKLVSWCTARAWVGLGMQGCFLPEFVEAVTCVGHSIVVSGSFLRLPDAHPPSDPQRERAQQCREGAFTLAMHVF